MNKEEHVHVVSEDDNVIVKVSKEECHAKHLLHRAVFVFVFDPKGNLYLRRIKPGKLTGSVSGHVLSNESYEEAAIRELKSGLGITIDEYDLEKVFDKFKGPHEYDPELITLFTVSKTFEKNQIKFDKEKTEEVISLSTEKIKEGIDNNELDTEDTFKRVFLKYLEMKG
jgi:isopentenyldiphosphate isomerase